MMTLFTFVLLVCLMCLAMCVQAKKKCNIYDTSEGFPIYVGSTMVDSCTECNQFCLDQGYGEFWYDERYTNECSFPSTCPADAVGDPHFTGFDGVPFDFPGYDGGFFNIYSDSSHQVNAEFSSFGMDSQTFIKAVGILFFPPCISIKILTIPVMENGTWVAHVDLSVDGKSEAGHVQKWATAEGLVAIEQVTFVDGVYECTFTTPSLQIRISKEPASLHLDLSIKMLVDALPGRAHGILGQTAGRAVHGGSQIVGDEMGYSVGGLFQNNFAFNMFLGDCE